MEIERQLQEYRAKRLLRNVSNRPQVTASEGDKLTQNAVCASNDTKNYLESKSLPASDSEVQQKLKTNTRRAYVAQAVKKYDWILTSRNLLKVVFWLVLLGLFIELEFAAVFIVISLFYFIYVNTRTGSQSNDGGPSAYSVFNPDFETLDGQLTAEQFEREIRFQHL